MENIILTLKNGAKFKVFVDVVWNEDDAPEIGSAIIVKNETGIKECFMFSNIEDIKIID